MNKLALANTRSRIRMMTLYYYATINNSIVVGTGNKVEDFGVGFYTKYGDGGVDISPIADLMKSEVFKISRALEDLGQSEISTNTIGTMVMEGLKELDPVAYVRFASVYRNFREEKDFVQFVDKLDVYKKR